MRGLSKVILFALIAFVMLSGTAFAVTVTGNWQAPTTNCDGSPLTDLGGYVVFWGFSSGAYTDSLDVGNVNTVTIPFVDSDVEGQTVYIAVASYDLAGNRSDDPSGCGLSNEVSRPFAVTFPSPPVNMTFQ